MLQCVYAHDKTELRGGKKKKSKKQAGSCHDAGSSDAGLLSSSPKGRLRTISETSNGSTDSWSAVVGRERVRTISGTSAHSNSSLEMRELEEFDWIAWNAQSEVPADEELDYSWSEVSASSCVHSEPMVYGVVWHDVVLYCMVWFAIN